jgi:1-deoxy-D-xylulose-5-phosphate synthase
VSVELIKLGFINPIDYETIDASLQKTGRLLVLEDSAAAGSVGERVAAHIAARGVALKGLKLLNLGSRFVPQGSVEQLGSCAASTPARPSGGTADARHKKRGN